VLDTPAPGFGGWRGLRTGQPGGDAQRSAWGQNAMAFPRKVRPVLQMLTAFDTPYQIDTSSVDRPGLLCIGDPDG
jgi:hypothetical protein